MSEGLANNFKKTLSPHLHKEKLVLGNLGFLSFFSAVFTVVGSDSCHFSFCLIVYRRVSKVLTDIVTHSHEHRQGTVKQVFNLFSEIHSSAVQYTWNIQHQELAAPFLSRGKAKIEFS